MAGSPYKLTLRSEALERLSRHMPVKVPPDLSKQLATPMPGKLHSIAVKGAIGGRCKCEQCVCGRAHPCAASLSKVLRLTVPPQALRVRAGTATRM